MRSNAPSAAMSNVPVFLAESLPRRKAVGRNLETVPIQPVLGHRPELVLSNVEALV